MSTTDTSALPLLIGHGPPAGVRTPAGGPDPIPCATHRRPVHELSPPHPQHRPYSGHHTDRAGYRDAIADALHAWPADHGFPDDRPGECRWCGRSDRDVLVLAHESGTDTAHGHPDCAEPSYGPTPSCTGFPDACGADAGAACEPWCPSLAADPEPVDPDDGPQLVTYTQPHPDHGTWSAPPQRFDTRAAAEAYVAAVTVLAGPGACARRVWTIRPADPR